jgi:hypothetical protein
MGALLQQTPHKLLPEEDGEGEVEAQSAIHYVDHLRGAWARCRKKLHTSFYYLRRMGKGRLKLSPLSTMKIFLAVHGRVAARNSTQVITLGGWGRGG